MATSVDTQPSRPTKEMATLVQQIAKEMAADASYGPRWQPKLQDAMDFVLRCAVDLGERKVHSGAHAYEIDERYGCTCPDARIRDRYCKHWVAMEMQRRINARLQGGDMPAESKIQDSEEVNNLFGDRAPEPEPDDIPEPEVPAGVREATELAMASAAPTYPVHTEEQLVRMEGHQYTDYPYTFCIKRTINETDLMLTFRGTQMESTWADVAKMVSVLDRAAEKAQERHQATAPQAPPAPPAPPAPAGEKAVNHGAQPDSPYCQVHSAYYDLWTKGDRRWYAHKVATGGFCNPPR